MLGKLRGSRVWVPAQFHSYLVFGYLPIFTLAIIGISNLTIIVVIIFTATIIVTTMIMIVIVMLCVIILSKTTNRQTPDQEANVCT